MTGVIPRPDGWRLTTMNEIALSGGDAVVGGPFGSSLTTKDYVASGVPVIRGSNLAGEECRFVDDEFVYVSEEKAGELRRNTAEPGDVIFTQRGTLGQVAVVPTDARFSTYIVSQSQMRVRVDESVMLPRFLYWQYRGPFARRHLESRTLATGVPHINLGILKEFPVVVPPLPEQRRIGAILDEADALRRKRREALGLLDELLRSAFLEMFGDPVTNPRGWEMVALDTIADIASGVTKGRKLNGKPTVTVPYMRVANVQDGHIRLDDVSEIEVLPSDVERYRLQVGDVLLTEGGDPDKLGRGAVWYGEVDPCIHQNHIFRVRCDTRRLLPEFASTVLGSELGKRYFARSAKQTTGIASINMTQLRGAPVLVPPLREQRRWDSFVSEHRAQASAWSRQGEHLDSLFDSLLHRAFTGAL